MRSFSTGAEGRSLRHSAPMFFRCERGIIMLDNVFTPSHLVVLFAAVVFFFGGRRLPGLGRGTGEALKGFREGLKRQTNKAQFPLEEL
jgi:sec-independent protein translocase protein TatA